MRRSIVLPLAAAIVGVLASASATAQLLPNPILFVTHVPTPFDSATACSMFANHVADMAGAPRGGDLWIRYPDGTLKNLTRSAGFGVDGLQAAGAIAVREPSVHWSGTKALFSMVVGGASSASDRSSFRWQIYEITGLGRDESPVITRVAGQPQQYNNVSPIYGTDERIIFTSDRPTTGEAHLYPALDEYKGAPTNTGLWSLDPASGELRLLDNSPSGDFSPTIDSYGRLLVMRWDRLQRDRNADIDALGTGTKGTFNFTDESANGTPQYGVRTETFPEPQGSRTDLLAGTNMSGFEFNQFFTWQLNEDGTSMVTMNHLGRHEMRARFGRAITDDPNVVAFDYANTPRSNRNPITNFTQVRESPTTPGLYFGVNGVQSGTHGAGQIVSLTAAPSLDPEQTVVTYVTDPSTAQPAPSGGAPNPNHSGMYRNPTPLSNGTLIVSHSSSPLADANIGSASAPASRYAFRVKTLKQSGGILIPDQALTSGISKSVSYWLGGTLVSYAGELWETDPVEVRARQRPARRSATMPPQETSIFADEGVDVELFRSWLRERNMALIVMRDVRHRDRADHQQPFRLQVPGAPTPPPPGAGKVYDITHLQVYEGDYIRGHGLTSEGGTPAEGRRILAVPAHLPEGTNPPDAAAPAGAVRIGFDGSVASFVPAHRATTWQLTGTAGAPVVRERYWVTFQSGEVRVCASCHGTNDEAASPLNPIPQNPPQALRDLLRYWKAQALPAHIVLVSPGDGASVTTTPAQLVWQSDARAARYRVQLSRSSTFASTILDREGVIAATVPVDSLEPSTTYYWRVQGDNDYGRGEWSPVWSFTTAGAPSRADDAGTGALALRMERNRPDPFSATTQIRIELPSGMTSTISLWDMRGVRVATLLSERLGAGVHELTVDAGSGELATLPSGTYVVRLDADLGSRQIIMHLIRE
jgi:hypothetical protein